MATERISAVVTAGDGRAAKAVYGESKVYLEVAGRPLVAHVVAALQSVPEISDVWVIGDPDRLAETFSRDDLRAEIQKPLHIIAQHRNLLENVWQSYRRLLPGAGAEGRDPQGDDLDVRALYVSGDLPFTTPQEISQFVRRSLEVDCDYALGLVTEEAMKAFYPSAGSDGIRMAYFNLREGRFRQNNLHLVRPARVANRYAIEEMYENRFQREWTSVIGLAWRLVRRGGLVVLAYYLLMHLAGIMDRRGMPTAADGLRRFIRIARIERGVSGLLGCSFRFVTTDIGGSAVDVDNEHDFDIAKQRYEEWIKDQRERAERALGSPEPKARVTSLASGQDSGG
jgi:GTP:adenosylcobinamide-phosphate guanylyltransferase